MATEDDAELLSRLHDRMNSKAEADAKIEMLSRANEDLHRRLELSEQQCSRLQAERDYFMRQATELLTRLTAAGQMLQQAGDDLSPSGRTIRRPTPQDVNVPAPQQAHGHQPEQVKSPIDLDRFDEALRADR